MPTTLTLSYCAHVNISVPNALAKMLQEDKDGKIKWWTKWGDLYWIDEEGVEHRIKGEVAEVDYKYTDEEEWEDEEESDDEDESDDEKEKQ